MWNKPATGGIGLGGAPGGFGGAGAYGAATVPGAVPGAAGPANADHELTQVGPGETIGALAWSRQGCPKTLVCTGSWDKKVCVWELQPGANGTILSQPLAMAESTMPVLGVALSRNGACYYGGVCRTAWQWDLATGAKNQVAGGHEQPIGSIGYAEDEVAAPMLLTGGWDGKVHFWDLRSPTPARTEEFAGPIVSIDVAQSPMAVIVMPRKTVVFNLATMQRLGECDPNQYIKGVQRVGCALGNKQGFCVGSSCGRFAWTPIAQTNPETYCQKCHHVERVPNKQFDMYQVNMCTTAGGTLATGGSDGYVRLWSVGEKKSIIQLPPKPAFANVPVSAGAFNADGTMLAYAMSYDYSLGKGGANAQAPRGVFIKPMEQTWTRAL